MYCIFNWHRKTLSLYTVHLPGTERQCTFYWHRLALSPRIVHVLSTGTRRLYVYTVHFILSYHLPSVMFMYAWQGQILVRLKQWCIRTTWNLEATSEPGNCYRFLFFEGGRCGEVEWMTWSQTYFTNKQKKTVTCTSSLYVTWNLADKSSKFLTFKVANFR